MTIIETTSLCKNYGATKAVQDLNLRVPEGGISAFLGPNGHGKTTTIKMLLGLTHPSGGQGEALGFPITDRNASLEIRRRTGFVSEDKQNYGFMTVRQAIGFTRSLYPKWRRDRETELLREFELPTDRLVKNLSKGMRTKLGLLLAFCRGAELLILDEPSEGLDPLSSEIMLQQTIRAATDGATVFFSSHQLSEAERIADHVFLIVRGRIAVEGRLDELRQRYRRVNAVFASDPPPVDRWRDRCVEDTRVDRNTCSLLVSAEVDRVVSQLGDFGALSVEEHPVDLRELFLATAQRGNQ